MWGGRCVRRVLRVGLCRGPRGGRDLTGPPKRDRKRIGTAEASRLAELVARGEQGEALRLMREWRFSDEDAARW